MYSYIMIMSYSGSTKVSIYRQRYGVPQLILWLIDDHPLSTKCFATETTLG